MGEILGSALLRLGNETNWNTYQYSTVHKTVYEYEYLPPQMVSRGSIKRLTGNTIYGYTAKWHNRPCHVTNEAKKSDRPPPHAEPAIRRKIVLQGPSGHGFSPGLVSARPCSSSSVLCGSGRVFSCKPPTVATIYLVEQGVLGSLEGHCANVRWPFLCFFFLPVVLSSGGPLQRFFSTIDQRLGDWEEGNWQRKLGD